MIVYGPNHRYIKPTPQPLYVPEKADEGVEERAKRSRKAAMAKTLAEMLSNPAHRKHGTLYGYRCGCRCERCKQARTDYYARYRK